MRYLEEGGDQRLRTQLYFLMSFSRGRIGVSSRCIRSAPVSVFGRASRVESLSIASVRSNNAAVLLADSVPFLRLNGTVRLLPMPFASRCFRTGTLRAKRSDQRGNGCTPSCLRHGRSRISRLRKMSVALLVGYPSGQTVHCGRLRCWQTPSEARY